MDTTIETVRSSLAQRIAKVRNCMLVEVATDIPVSNKELFISLCQAYEQNSVEEASTADSLSYKTSPLDETQGDDEQSKDRIWWKLKYGSAVTGFYDSSWTDSQLEIVP